MHDRLGIQSSSRASVYLYNTEGEIDTLVDALVYARDFFAGKNTTVIALQFPTAAATTSTFRVWVSSGTVTP